MTTLWRPDTELQAIRRLPTWAAFHRALGTSDLHTQNERRIGGEWCVPYYSVIRGRDHSFRQLVVEGFGPTVLTALANGLLQLNGGSLLHRPAAFRCKVLMLEMLL